jgi:hypothetical protein
MPKPIFQTDSGFNLNFDPGGVLRQRVPDFPSLHHLALQASLDSDGITIDLVEQVDGELPPRRRASFRLSAMLGDITVSDNDGYVQQGHPPFSGLSRSFMGLKGVGSLSLSTGSQSLQSIRIFGSAPPFVLSTLNQRPADPWSAPLFLTDSRGCYFLQCKPAAITVIDTLSAPAAAVPANPASWVNAVKSTSVSISPYTSSTSNPWLRDDAKRISAATQSGFLQVGGVDSVDSALKQNLFNQVTLPSLKLNVTPFSHPVIDDFMEVTRRKGVQALFSLQTQASVLGQLHSGQDFASRYAPDPAQVVNPDLVEGVDFASGSPWGSVNAELFLHLPLFFQSVLSENGRDEEALRWGDSVLDLLSREDNPEEAWRYLPFRQAAKTQTIVSIYDALSGSAPDGDSARSALAQLEASRLYPFEPFRIARLRPEAMMKYAFLQNCNCRLDLADRRFSRYTPEGVDRALPEYLIVQAAFGFKQEILPGNPPPAKTYAELRQHLDQAGNAVLSLESHASALAALDAPSKDDSAKSTLLRLVASRYFCIPPNPKLLAMWDRVADRLYKIRNGLTIDGVRRPLSLYGPRVDPADAVSAVAGGASPASLGGLGAIPRPLHRFPTQLRLFREANDRLAGITQRLLQTFERGDAEELAAMHASHEDEMAQFIAAARQSQIDEAQQTINSLQSQRNAALVRWRHYREQLGFLDLAEPGPNKDGQIETGQRGATRAFKLVDGFSYGLLPTIDPAGFALSLAIGINPQLQTGKILAQEQEELALSFAAAATQGVASHLEVAAGILQALPNFEAAAKPTGVGAGVHVGGVNLGGAIAAHARAISAQSGSLSYLAGNAGKQASFVWRERESVLQLNSAAAEVLHIDQLIIGAQKTLEVRKQEKTIHDEQAKRHKLILEYHASKFTSADLYATMASQLAIYQRQSFSVAYRRLEEARRCFEFQFPFAPLPSLPSRLWDVAPRGLLSADALAQAAQELEQAYLSQPEGLKLIRTFSLRQIDPYAFLSLREYGICDFRLSKALWDLYDPGHCERRIVEVRLTIPAVTGPHVPINATVRLTDTNTTVIDEDGNVERIEIPNSSSVIVTSSGRDDNGEAGRERRDDLYMPFEGAGAEGATFQLQLPKEYPLFPRRQIADALITVIVQTSFSTHANALQKAESEILAGLNKLSMVNQADAGYWHLVMPVSDAAERWQNWKRDQSKDLTLSMTRDQLPDFLGNVKAEPSKVVAIWAPLLQRKVLVKDKEAQYPGLLTTTSDTGQWEITIKPPPDGLYDDVYTLVKFDLKGSE